MSKNLKTILGILGVLILVYGLWYFKSIVTYVIISAVISLIGTPIVNKLCKIKIGKKFIPQSAAALAALTLMIASLVAMVSLFAPLLAEQAQVFSNIDVEKTAESFEQPLSETEAWLSQFNLSGDERSNKEFFIDKMQGLVDFQQIGATFNNLFGVIGNAFIAFFSILFISFFFLKDSGTVAKIVKTITPDQHLTKIDEIMTDTKIMLRRYFIGIIIQITIVTLMVTAGLWILGIENALLIGFLAGIINLVPYLGPIIGACIALFVTLTTGLSAETGIELIPLMGRIVLVFAIVQLTDNFLIQPYVFSTSVKAHPLEIFVVISIAGTLAGVTGMILAIPAYTLIRIVAKEFLSGFKIVDSLTKNL